MHVSPHRRENSELGADCNQAPTVFRPKGFLERINKRCTVPVARRLAGITWIRPAHITWASAGIGGLLSAWLVLECQYVLAGILILIGALLDSLDGDLAKAQGRASPEGAILDAVLDRYVDFAIVGAIILASPVQHLAVGLAGLLGTMLVPYVRAKTEAAGRTSAVTIGSRDVRNAILVVGLFTGNLFALLVVLAIVSNAAAFHRFALAIRRRRP